MAPIPHIIIADDIATVRGVIARIVARSYPAIRISAVQDGQDALDLFQAEGADLIITNQQMQRLTGLELIAAIRASNATVPIIMVSSEQAIEPQARSAGANAFVIKPFSVQDLSSVLQTLLRAP